MKIILLLIISIIGNIAFADSDAIVLDKGQPAPWPGILLTNDRAQSARKAEIELGQYKLLNESFQKSLDIEKSNIDFFKQKVDILTIDNQNLSSSLQKERSSNDLNKVFYFLGGIVLTSLAIEGANKLR